MAGLVFSGLAPLVIDEVARSGGVVRVRARTPDGPAACPGCGALTDRVHSRHRRRLAGVAVDEHTVVVVLAVRQLWCPTAKCLYRTFREQVPGVVERYQRRTTRLAGQIGAVVKELAGGAGARVLGALKIGISRHTAVRQLLRLPLPDTEVARVLGVDDFAFRKSHGCGTILIDAATRQRIDVLPDRRAATLEARLRDHPGVEVVCRDSSGGYAEAVRRALPEAIQVGDRWHIWRNLGDAVWKEVKDHSTCWGKGGPVRRRREREETTRQRWQRVHEVLDEGVGLLENARRVQLGLNTVKRYARTTQPERLRRAPQYRSTLVDPFRQYLPQRRTEDPAVPVTLLLDEIKALGYKGSQNLLYRYINQGRVEADRLPVSAGKLAELITANPDKLDPDHRHLLSRLTGACTEITALTTHLNAFAQLLRPCPGNATLLEHWITDVHTCDLPHLHTFIRGLRQDFEAATAALTTPYHNGGTEGVNTKTKMIKRQTYGRTGSPCSDTTSYSPEPPSTPEQQQSRK